MIFSLLLVFGAVYQESVYVECDDAIETEVAYQELPIVQTSISQPTPVLDSLPIITPAAIPAVPTPTPLAPAPVPAFTPSAPVPALPVATPVVIPAPKPVEVATPVVVPAISPAIGGQAKCIAALGMNQMPGGLTCHHSYNKPNPLEAGYGGCDTVKTSLGGIVDIELVWAFAKSKGFLVKGGGNCYDVEKYTFNGKSVTLIVVDNGSAMDISREAYDILASVQSGPNCEDAVCPIGNFKIERLGNIKSEFQSFSKSYLAQKHPSVTIDYMG